MRQFWGRLAGLLIVVSLATYGCSGGDGGAVQTNGAQSGGSVSITVPQTSPRVTGVEVTDYTLELLQGTFPDFFVVYEQNFPRQSGAEQTLSLSGIEPGNYLLRLLYEDGQQVVQMFQTTISVGMGQTVTITNPDYEPARTFTGLFTATVPASDPFPVPFVALSGGFDTAVDVDPVQGGFDGDVSQGVYRVNSPISGTFDFDPQSNAFVFPDTFPAGPALTNTVEIGIFDQNTNDVLIVAADQSGTYTHTVGQSSCPQTLGTFIFINNLTQTVTVSPSSNSSYITTIPQGTDLGGGVYSVPGNSTLNILTQFNCLTSTGQIQADIVGQVGGVITTTVGAPITVTIFPSPGPTRAPR